MTSVFSSHILADKLSKLNSTQQCIETLSHWCIFHRKKAQLVVETWAKQFHSSQKEQKVPFLYLANDILQNSRKKGNEFVSEFWKVLPAALKDVFENVDEDGKNSVSRLVNIWEERKVFGSRARGLKDLMLGEDPPPPLQIGRKSSRSVRIVRRDPHSIRAKLAIGGAPEKIVSAFHSVHSEHAAEETALSKCKEVVRRVGKMEKDVDVACTRAGDPQRTTLANELKEQEEVLKHWVEKLETVEATRAALVSRLQEALGEQETELANIRNQLQTSRDQVEEASHMQKRLNGTIPSSSKRESRQILDKVHASSADASEPKSAAAAIAAKVVDKLAASTKSAQVLSSVLSTFAAEAMSAGLKTISNTPSNQIPGFSPEKKLKLERPMLVSENQAGFFFPQPIPGSVASQNRVAPQNHVLVLSGSHMDGQISTSQPQLQMLPGPPPPQQFSQQAGPQMMFAPQYGYITSMQLQPPLPPPPPPPQLMNLAIPPPAIPQQPPTFRPLQPPSMMFYTNPHQPN